MSGIVWLASYPKSGNTWFRLLLANARATEDSPADINDPGERTTIASARHPFDELTLIESGLLTPDETDVLRPGVLEMIAAGTYAALTGPHSGKKSWDVSFMKVHDAYTLTPRGVPLLGAGARAIVIVRDPRGVAPSLANHLGCPLDEAIGKMASEQMAFADRPHRQTSQLRQKLLSWSSHLSSWLDQRDMPVHLVRYEDLRRDTVRVFRDAMHFAGCPVSESDARRAAQLSEFSQLQEQERAKGFREWRSQRGGVFFRRGEAESWREELSPAQIARIQSDHGALMTRLGYAFFRAAPGEETAAHTPLPGMAMRS